MLEQYGALVDMVKLALTHDIEPTGDERNLLLRKRTYLPFHGLEGQRPWTHGGARSEDGGKASRNGDGHKHGGHIPAQARLAQVDLPSSTVQLSCDTYSVQLERPDAGCRGRGSRPLPKSPMACRHAPSFLHTIPPLFMPRQGTQLVAVEATTNASGYWQQYRASTLWRSSTRGKRHAATPFCSCFPGLAMKDWGVWEEWIHASADTFYSSSEQVHYERSTDTTERVRERECVKEYGGRFVALCTSTLYTPEANGAWQARRHTESQARTFICLLPSHTHTHNTHTHLTTAITTTGTANCEQIAELIVYIRSQFRPWASPSSSSLSSLAGRNRNTNPVGQAKTTHALNCTKGRFHLDHLLLLQRRQNIASTDTSSSFPRVGSKSVAILGYRQQT
ncbi:hypothetical protein CSIM01_06594 [Colletotrichum simmondsii]|uniref:Uncharacterized protein n=1 Tax=Colletotrichum simmondsii TaxID=703756 RepID=A0A135SVM3_9PEZI|nr:hypothetical protein CSIM01_06594 [Colletotrichum simmondsii]